MYQRHPEEHRLQEREYTEMYRVATMTRSVDDSKLLNLRGGPMVITSASGMLTWGRILHHPQAYGPDPKTWWRSTDTRPRVRVVPPWRAGRGSYGSSARTFPPRPKSL
ncbi:hypothetical protein [Pseudarthrobacter cellobiosi]|uniref:hypothetical protein n=1 Tax=Pseudarthrobacter cellobiosi TaxID=2953654 RepID=UPI0027E224CB|nr:hypothetical protein [Pseudarthrobacter sp. HLT1-5]